MSSRHNIQDATGVIERLAPVGNVQMYFFGVPTASFVGAVPGCIAQDVTNGNIYRNSGTAASATWTQLNSGTDLSGLLATATELNRSSDVSTRTITVTGTTLVATQDAHDGKTIVLDRATGIAVTLPDATAANVGCRFRFVVKTTFTGAASIKSSRGSDIMIGHATMGNNSDNTTVDWQATAASTYDTIDLFGTANSTGGIEGQVVSIECIAANFWFVEIQGDAAGTEATPFQDTVT